MKHTVAFIFVLSFLGACANFNPHKDCFNPDLEIPYDECFKYDGGQGGLKDIPKDKPKDPPKDPKPPVDHPKDPPKDKPKDKPKDHPKGK